MAPKKARVASQEKSWTITVSNVKMALKRGRPCGRLLRLDAASLPGPLARQIVQQAKKSFK